MSLLATLAQHVNRRPQRMVLLQQIAAQGSITRAAKAAGLSYKAAWDAIAELNNLAGVTLVARSVGGKGGGGAHLTTDGERLLALHQRLEAVQAQLLQLAEDDADLARLGRLMLRTSARNQLAGEVRSIEPHGPHQHVRLALPGDLSLVAAITQDSVEQLQLTTGTPVVALFKAGAVALAAPEREANEGLPGRLQRIDRRQGGPHEASIALRGGQTLCALLDADSPVAWREGDDVRARVSPTQIILGTAL